MWLLTIIFNSNSKLLILSQREELSNRWGAQGGSSAGCVWNVCPDRLQESFWTREHLTTKFAGGERLASGSASNGYKLAIIIWKFKWTSKAAVKLVGQTLGLTVKLFRWSSRILKSNRSRSLRRVDLRTSGEGLPIEMLHDFDQVAEDEPRKKHFKIEMSPRER